MQTVGVQAFGFIFGKSLLHVPVARPLTPVPTQGPCMVRALTVRSLGSPEGPSSTMTRHPVAQASC